MTMAPEFVDTDMHPPTPIGDEAVDVFEPNEEDIMATGILDDSDAEEPNLSKLAALSIVYGQRPPT